MARPSSSFKVVGLAPTDARWAAAPESVRRSFWREVVRLVVERNEYDRVRGRDRHGRKLRPVSRFTRANRRSGTGHKADPNAPPLVPADAYSRTIANFAGRAFPDHAEFFWRDGWGKVLHFHRIGARNAWAKSGRLPVRDVIGVTPESLRLVEKRMALWWAEWVRAHPPRPVVPRPVRTFPKVLYLKPGERPRHSSRAVQVYEGPRVKPVVVPARVVAEPPPAAPVRAVPAPVAARPVLPRPLPLPARRASPPPPAPAPAAKARTGILASLFAAPVRAARRAAAAVRRLFGGR